MDAFATYPNDARHMQSYIAYQARYRDTPRESDKVILAMLEGMSGRLLDIGCSTGNLLRHIRAAYPAMELVGGDLSEIEIEACRNDDALAGIDFRVMDILDLPEGAFDVVTANAILYGFAEERFDAALVSIGRALRPGGRLIAFDFFHPFNQEISILERSASFPDGHPLHFRSYRRTESALSKAGFGKPTFAPFKIPVALAFQGHDSVGTYTSNGFQFRGCLVQPWCHLMVRSS